MWRVAAALVWLLAVGAAAPVATGFAPTPNGPVFGGVPGALPTGFHYVYKQTRRGWPVDPVFAQHPIRGSFLDPRGSDDDGLSGYHFGIDINVDDATPEAGAPAGYSHRVYALESGVVSTPRNVSSRKCVNQRLDVGHFSYWHVAPILAARTRVKAGQQIGWTCRGVWHLHLSEWQKVRGKRVWVNPLHPGGLLTPYADTAAPVVRALSFFTPPLMPWLPTKSLVQPDTATRLRPDSLHGLVELRAEIGDPQSFLGFLGRNPAWPTEFTPYRVSVEIVNAAGRRVLARVSFQADQMPQTPYLVHYAPGTVEPDNMQECVGPPALKRCAGTYWFRPFSRFREEYWNTRAFPNGSYRVTVRAYDLHGNVGARSADVIVRN